MPTPDDIVGGRCFAWFARWLTPADALWGNSRACEERLSAMFGHAPGRPVPPRMLWREVLSLGFWTRDGRSPWLINEDEVS